MRSQYIENCKTKKEAKKVAPWAGWAVKLKKDSYMQGYMAFESSSDYNMWLSNSEVKRNPSHITNN